MNRAAARKVIASSRRYGWMRPDVLAPAGYRSCPVCRAECWGHSDHSRRGDALARAINDKIDGAMLAHIDEEHPDATRPTGY